MNTKRYATDLTDEQFALVYPFTVLSERSHPYWLALTKSARFFPTAAALAW